MRLLVLGRTGQVAQALFRLGDGALEITCLDRAAADLRAPHELREAIASARADAVINAAAYTAVDQAETDLEKAFAVNAEAPAVLAQAAARRGLPFLHISTDYVFDGQGTAPFRPEDAPRPLSVYGASKLAGEEAVRAAGGRHVILRTSWVFSELRTNFVWSMLQQAWRSDRLDVVSDQVGGPTYAGDIAAALVQIARALVAGQEGGTFHYAGQPDVSRAEFARAILARAGLGIPVRDVPSASFPTPAERPLNSRLDCRSMEQAFGLARPGWRDGLARVIRAWTDEEAR